MTGTGTQDNPYIVLNYEDFCNMTGGTDKYYKLGADIDFAQTDRKSDAGAIHVSMAELDGDGHSILNFFSKSYNPKEENFFLHNDGSSRIVIKNTNFKGIYLSGGTTCFTDKSLYFFSNCRFYIKINDTSSYENITPIFPKSGLEDSEVLVEGTSDITKPIILGNVSGCLVKLDLTFFNKYFANEIDLFNGSISFSGIMGNIVTVDKGGAVYTFRGGTVLNSYFALHFDKISSFSISNSVSGINFYDKEVMANLVGKMPSASNFYALTTEQCKSAEYLQSIDFPCSAG